MNSAIGLVIAFPAEARALFGRGSWQRREGRVFRHLNLNRDTGLLIVRSGLGRVAASNAAAWLVKKGVAALSVLGVSGGLDPSLASGDVVLVDVRSVTEFEPGGGLPNAINVPLEEIEAKIVELPKGKAVVMYCNTGARAQMAFNVLKKKGVKAKYVKARVSIDPDKKGEYTIED